MWWWWLGGGERGRGGVVAGKRKNYHTWDQWLINLARFTFLRKASSDIITTPLGSLRHFQYSYAVTQVSNNVKYNWPTNQRHATRIDLCQGCWSIMLITWAAGQIASFLRSTINCNMEFGHKKRLYTIHLAHQKCLPASLFLSCVQLYLKCHIAPEKHGCYLRAKGKELTN